VLTEPPHNVAARISPNVLKNGILRTSTSHLRPLQADNRP
jgi:hypothetical protein